MTHKKVDMPEFEMCSCPSVDLNAMKSAKTRKQKESITIRDPSSTEVMTVGTLCKKAHAMAKVMAKVLKNET